MALLEVLQQLSSSCSMRSLKDDMRTQLRTVRLLVTVLIFIEGCAASSLATAGGALAAYGTEHAGPSSAYVPQAASACVQ